jgi:hypothetical protein
MCVVVFILDGAFWKWNLEYGGWYRGWKGEMGKERLLLVHRTHTFGVLFDLYLSVSVSSVSLFLFCLLCCVLCKCAALHIYRTYLSELSGIYALMAVMDGMKVDVVYFNSLEAVWCVMIASSSS